MDTIYYTNEKGEPCTYDVINGPSWLSVLKDSLIVSKNGYFSEDTYIVDNGSEVINRYAIKIKTATVIDYADGAPM